MKIHKNVISGQCKGSLMRIQIGYTAIFIGTNWLPIGWSGLQFGIFAPDHNSKIGYRRIAFYGSFLPGLPGSVGQWPKWYKWLNRQMSFRRRFYTITDLKLVRGEL
jgi:hypothetical protein